MCRETELFGVHSHRDTVELGQVEDGDAVSEVRLCGIELEVTEGTDIDDVLCSGLLDVLQVGLGELLGDVSECGLESSSGSAAEGLLLPGHALGTGGLDQLVQDLGVLGVVQSLDVAGLAVFLRLLIIGKIRVVKTDIGGYNIVHKHIVLRKNRRGYGYAADNAEFDRTVHFGN